MVTTIKMIDSALRRDGLRLVVNREFGEYCVGDANNTPKQILSDFDGKTMFFSNRAELDWFMTEKRNGVR